MFFSFWVLLVFFWCSSGVFLVFDNTEEHQKNPEEPRRTQKEKNTSPPQFSTFNGIDGGGKSAPLRSRKFCQDGSALGTGREHLVAVVGDGDLRDRSI